MAPNPSEFLLEHSSAIRCLSRAAKRWSAGYPARNSGLRDDRLETWYSVLKQTQYHATGLEGY